MAIHIQEEQSLQQGHQKSIDEAGIMMVFDTLQKYQYAFPIKSTVRELLSNGVDSVSEKKVAIEILTGKAKVSDFFVEMEGDLYKDSHFDPSYYDLNWLSNDNTVLMSYQIGGAMEKDKVIFKDYGVGLFGKRLEGYFKIAYSTKRLSKLPLGKFGLGAKSPLSTGVDFFTVESRYNGKLFRFNVYNSKVDSIIPRMNMETGQENRHIVFGEGTEHEYPVYWIPTTEKNGLTITLEAKKHHRSQYIDAVKSQMLYFDNIRMTEDVGGIITNHDYKAKILYEDDLIVLSDNNYYSKPHLLLNKVNYGYIAWEELELEEKNGNIGIKVAPEDVEVNPSRESVLWTEKTKNKVLARFNEVVDVAAGMIQQELQSTDFLQWLKTCYSVYSRYTERGGIVGRLSKIVDLSRAKFKFLPDERIIFDAQDPMPGLFMRAVEVFQERDASKVMKKKVLRKDFQHWGSQLGKPVFLMKQGERAMNRKDKWLYTQYPSGFITVMEPYQTLDEAEKAGATPEELKRMYTGKTINRTVYWEALKASEGITWYEKVEVPEEFTGNDQDVEEAPVEDTHPLTVEEIRWVQTAKQTAEERRKQQGKTLINVLSSINGSRSQYRKDENNQLVKDENGKLVVELKAYEFTKMEVPIADINSWDAKEIYYGYEADSELMHFMAMITRDPAPGNLPGKAIRRHAPTVEIWTRMKWWRKNKERLTVMGVYEYHAYYMQHFFDSEVIIIKISQNNSRYYKDFSRVQEFFITIQNKVITMSNQLIKWNTARLIRQELGCCAFLYNFPFNAEFADMYQQLCLYVDRNYREVEEYATAGRHYGMNTTTYNDMIQHLDMVHKFQKFVINAPNDHEGIGQLAGQLFGNKELRDGMAVDPEMMAKLKEVTEYAQACGNLLNFMPILTGYSTNAARLYTPGESRTHKVPIPEELEHEIRSLLDAKGVLDTRTSTGLMEEHLQIVHESTTDAEIMQESQQ